MKIKKNLTQLLNSEIDLIEAYKQLKAFSKAERKDETFYLAGLIEDKVFTKIKKDTPIQAGDEKYHEGFEAAVDAITKWMMARCE